MMRAAAKRCQVSAAVVVAAVVIVAVVFVLRVIQVVVVAMDGVIDVVHLLGITVTLNVFAVLLQVLLAYLS